MSIDLYELSIPIFQRELRSMLKFLKKGEAWCDEQGKPHSVLLEGQLAPDMKIHVASTQALWVMSRVGGSEEVKLEHTEKTFAELYERINKTLEILKTAKREDYNNPNKEVVLNLPHAQLKLTALTYIQRFALTNFFFHDTAAYLILRNAGVPVGKADFLDGATIEAPSVV